MSDWTLGLKALIKNTAVVDDQTLIARINEVFPPNIHCAALDSAAENVAIYGLNADTLAKIKSSVVTQLGACFFKLDSRSHGIWLVQYESQEKAAWLIIIDEQGCLNETNVETLFYSVNSLFSRRDLQRTRQELAAANDWIAQELEDISRLQHLMLPDKSLSIPGVSVAYTYKAMAGAGGDYLDIMDLSKDRDDALHDFGAIVADVTGHGPSAAVEAAMIDAILRTFKPSRETEGPTQVLEYINQHFFTRKERGRFLTANVFRYLGQTRTLTYGNAGHPHAYIKRKNTLYPLDQGGIPIGVLRNNQWETYTFDIQTGDMLFIYTDVIIETKNNEGDDFGFERLETSLKEAPNEPKALLEFVECSLRTFCKCGAFRDDMTLCVIKFD